MLMRRWERARLGADGRYPTARRPHRVPQPHAAAGMGREGTYDQSRRPALYAAIPY
jgi:hypothetical protein